MEVKLRGLDRYEVEAIQYDGTNSDEICQFILEHKPYTQIEGAFLNKGADKKMMAVIVIPSGEDIWCAKRNGSFMLRFPTETRTPST